MSEDLLDQAAGLRRWASQQQMQTAEAAPASRTLLLYGPRHQVPWARQTLERWHAQGRQWVGDPARWHVLAHDSTVPAALAEGRWSVWIDRDAQAFRKAFRALQALRQQGGPASVLALHAGLASPGGLLDNLREAAAGYLGIRLLIIDEWNAG